MDTPELARRVARLMPRRLRRDAEGAVVEEVRPAPAAPVAPVRRRRAPRVPRPSPPVPDAAVGEVELLPNELEPGARDVRERLLAAGASPTLADRVVRGVLARDARGAYAIDAGAELLGSAFTYEPPPRGADAPHVLAFVGPTGAGKTAVLARLGRRLLDAGRDVFFATLDPLSVGVDGAARLRTDVDRTELPLTVVRDAVELHAALVERGGSDLVLLDTPGLSPRDEQGLAELGDTLTAVRRLGTPHVYLVLPAGASRAALGLAADAFRRARPTAAVVAKLDETTEPGAVLEEAQRAGLPLAFLCDGQDVRQHLARATPDRVADLFLRGQLR